MENTDSGTEIKPAAKRHPRPLWVRFVHYSIRQARKRKAQKQPQSTADKAASRTAGATVAIAFLTLILAVVSYFQWKEIHAGSTDTHTLAVAAGNQATWTQRLANNAGDQLLVLKNQLLEMRAEQRPWIYADIRPNGAVYRTQSGGFGFPVAFILQNTGHLPAQFAMPYLDAHTSRWLYDHHETFAQAQQNSCQQGITKFRTDKERGGATVFPNHPQMIGEAIGVSQRNWDRGSLSTQNGFGAEVEVAGCVVYSYGNKIGTTGFAFSFAWNKGKQSTFNTFVLPRDPTTVPANQIVITAWPVASVWQAN